MSIYETISDVQRRNSIIMEDLEAGTITLGSAISASCSNWEDVVLEFKYPAERIDLTPLNKQNAAFIAQLANKDINAAEATALSNRLWVDAINKIRRPDMAQFNTQKYHSKNYLEPNF